MAGTVVAAEEEAGGVRTKHTSKRSHTTVKISLESNELVSVITMAITTINRAEICKFRQQQTLMGSSDQ